MSKTEPSFRETKLGILEIKEIEWIIFDNLIQVKSYIFRNFKNINFNVETFCLIHKLLWENLFDNSWKYRLHQVKLWDFTPIQYFKVPIEIKLLDDDINIRLNNINTVSEKKEFLAYVMWKFLWIHPFFDYNWRTARLIWELFLLQQNMNLSDFSSISRKDFTEAMKYTTETWDFSKIIELI
jgi:fido (protein-threonine AMPylation protein)